MAKYVFDPNNDDGIKYPNDKVDPQNVPETLPDSPDFYDTALRPPADSKFSTGRGCPRCGGDLKLFEYIKADDLVVLQCKKCTRKWHHPDLENDEIFRIIPKDMMYRYANAINRRAQRREQGKD